MREISDHVKQKLHWCVHPKLIYVQNSCGKFETSEEKNKMFEKVFENQCKNIRILLTSCGLNFTNARKWPDERSKTFRLQEKIIPKLRPSVTRRWATRQSDSCGIHAGFMRDLYSSFCGRRQCGRQA